MRMAFSNVDAVGRDVGSQDEEAVLVPADIEAFALPHGVELSAVVLPYDLSEGVLFPPGLAHMFLGFSFHRVLRTCFLPLR